MFYMPGSRDRPGSQGDYIAAPGSVLNPSFAFARGGRHDGMWSLAPGTVNFSANGAEVIRYDSAQRITIGGVANQFGSIFEIHVAGGVSGNFARWTGDAFGVNWNFRKSRAATIGGRSAVTTSDALGSFNWSGDDGTNFSQAVSMQGQVDAAVSTGIVPGRWLIQTNNASGVATEAMRIDSSQRVGIGVVPSHYLDILAGTATIAPQRFASGTNLTSATAGCLEFDGKAFYATSVASSRQVTNTEQVQVLSGSRTFSNNTSAQAIFNATANGAVTLAASTSYEFEMVVGANTFSASAHTISLTFATSGSFTSIAYYFASSPGPNALAACSSGFITVGTVSAVTAAGITTQGLSLYVRGIIRMNASGTVTPQLTQSTNSAAAVVLANSFFRCWPIGTDAVTNIGNWS